MKHFSLFAHGESFDVDRYLATSTLQFDEVWRVGEGPAKSSGVRKLLGDSEGLTLPQQERIAVAYMTANRDALKALRRFPGVTTFILGLQLDLALSEDVVSFAMGHSVRLLRHALDIGLEPTFYVRLDRDRGRESNDG